MKEELLASLFSKYLAQSCTGEEEMRLMELLNDPELDNLTGKLIEQFYDRLPQQFRMTDSQSETVFRNITGHTSPSAGTFMSRSRIPRLAIAASILFLLALGSYIFLNTRPRISPKPEFAKKTEDISSPAVNRAVITLANGQSILLDSAGEGTLAVQGHVRVIKTPDGAISYYSDKSGVGASLYNTLRNPRGSKIVSLKLADGTRVWLNAESSLRYPTSFTGPQRRVEVTGEAYFEVAGDARIPFVVSKGGMDIQVLGTSFNVNAYDDEQDMKVTLLEGVVRVSSNGNVRLLRPGQQAKVHADIRVVDHISVEQVMAWKNGFFHFQGASLQEVMRQLGRWYDVEVSYEGTIADHEFVGTVGRDYNLSEVLAVLGASDVHFRIEGKRLIVQP